MPETSRPGRPHNGWRAIQCTLTRGRYIKSDAVGRPPTPKPPVEGDARRNTPARGPARQPRRGEAGESPVFRELAVCEPVGDVPRTMRYGVSR